MDPETLLSKYSIVFQDVTLFNNSVMENIRIGKNGMCMYYLHGTGEIKENEVKYSEYGIILYRNVFILKRRIKR